MFKLISTTKSRRDAQRAVRYVARVRPGDRDEPGVETVQLRDGEGEVLTRARPGAPFEESRTAADAAFEALELTPEAENLTTRKGQFPPSRCSRARRLQKSIQCPAGFCSRSLRWAAARSQSA